MRQRVWPWIVIIGIAPASGLVTNPTSAEGADFVGGLVSEVDLEMAGLTRYWQARLPLRPGDCAERAYRVDDELFVLSNLNDLYVLKANEGLLRWTANVTEPGFLAYPPTLNVARGGSTKVVVTATDGTTIFDRFNGAVLYRFKLPFPPGGSTLAAGNFLFTGGSNARLYAQLLEKGASAPFKMWEVRTGGPITSAPILFAEENLLFASHDGGVYACHAVDKTLLWSYRTGGAITGDLAVDDDGVYVASADRSVYKLDLFNGSLVWRTRLSKPLEEGPVVAGDTVYQYSPREGFIALSADNGAEKWRRRDGRKLAARTKSGDVIRTGTGLIIVEPQSGDVVTTIGSQTPLDVAVNPTDDAVFLFAPDGRVACLRSADVPYLRRQQVQSVRNQLNLPPSDVSRVLDPPPPPLPAKPTLDDPFRSRREQNP